MINISKFKTKDIPKLSDLFVNSFSRSEIGRIVSFDKKVIAEALKLYSSEIVLVAHDGSKPVGLSIATTNISKLRDKANKASVKWKLPWRSFLFSPIHKAYKDKPFYLFLVVSPEHRHKGIATKLWHRTEKELTKKKVNEIYFQILRKNTPAVELVEAWGAEFVDSVGPFKWCLIGKKKVSPRTSKSL